MRRALRSGEALAHIGLFLPRDFAPSGGIDVLVSGSAIERSVIEPCAVRSWPFGAKPAPWEASGWERSLVKSAEANDCTEAYEARLRATNTGHRGVWLAILGIARRPERAELTVTARSPVAEKRETFALDVRVHEADTTARRSSWFAGDRAWNDCVTALTRTLDDAITSGSLAGGDRISLRAVSRDGSRERLATATIPKQGRLRSGGLRSMSESARVGRYATLEVIREAEPSDEHGSFVVLAARRRDRSGDWGVELRLG